MRITQKWIKQHVRNKSFADIGGLWQTLNERVSDAAKSGASHVTMADIAPPGNKLWRDFETHLEGLGISGCNNVSADIMAPDAVERIGIHDIVHCSGVVYHMPDFIGCIRNLKALTRSHLIIVSMVVPERIETSKGTIELTGGDAIFVPGVSDLQRAILSEFFDSRGTRVHTVNGREIQGWINRDGSPRFGPWWWLFTPAFLHRALEISELRVIDEGPVVEGRSYGFRCQKSG